MSKLDLRLLVLYDLKLQHNVYETSTNIHRTWGEGSTCDRTVPRWFQIFRIGDESFKVEEGIGQACSLYKE